MFNVRNGFGHLTKKNGDTYEGYWFDGHMHGPGLLKVKDGLEYNGSFLNGEISGQGHMTRNGNVHIGTFEDGIPSGYGEHQFSNGQTLKGIFSGELCHGILTA